MPLISTLRVLRRNSQIEPFRTIRHAGGFDEYYNFAVCKSDNTAPSFRLYFRKITSS